MTSIEWTSETWNPITGCNKVSPGCANCYAEGIAKRFWGDRSFTDVQFHQEQLQMPFKWKKPRRVFVNSMSDLFHESITDEQIDQIFAVMALTPQHTYQILTKRPARMLDYCSNFTIEQLRRGAVLAELPLLRSFGKGFTTLPNVWLGVTCENQKTVDERIPLLLNTSAAVHFLSCEPLLRAIDLSSYLSIFDSRKLWVIVGGETGLKSRPCNIDWLRSVVDQCQKANVPVFVKQLGSTSIIREFSIEEYREKKSPGFDFPEGTFFGNKTGIISLNGRQVLLNSSKGGDMAEWPEDLRVREFPKG